MQVPQYIALMAKSTGSQVIHQNIYYIRYKHQTIVQQVTLVIKSSQIK